MSYLFYGEALLNFISGLGFLVFPRWNLETLIPVTSFTLLDKMLCRWWAAMLWMQASMLFFAAKDKRLRSGTYKALLVGEIVLIPILIQHIIETNIWFPTLTFIFTLLIFAIFRCGYLWNGLFLGDLVPLLLNGVSHIVGDINQAAVQSKDKIAIRRLGPPGCPYLAIANGPDAETVKLITSGHIPELRKTFDALKVICGLENGRLSSQFAFQSDNVVTGRNKLKKYLSGPYLEQLAVVARDEFTKLFDNMNRDQSIHKTIGNTVFKIFSKVSLGFNELPPNTFEIMEEIQMLTIKGSQPMRWGAKKAFVRGQKLYIDLCNNLLKLNRDSILQGNNYIYSLMEELDGAKSIDDPEIIRNMPTLFFGLSNPVALLEFSLYILDQHPEVANRLKQDPTYIMPVFKELLRYICPANLLFRYVGEDVHLDSHKLKKGSFMGTCLRSILRDPDHWKDPEVFNPDRFIENPISFQFPNVPFSIGDRICPAVQATEYIFREFISVWKNYRFVPNLSGPFQMPPVDAIARLPESFLGHFEKISV